MKLKKAGKRFENSSLDYKIYETRYKDEIPDIGYDIYISSGSPGDSFEGIGSKWENKYFNLLDNIWSNNQNKTNRKNMYFLFVILSDDGKIF